MQLLKFQLWSYLTEKTQHSFTFITNEHQIVTLQLMTILSRVSGNNCPEILFLILLSMIYTVLPTKKVINDLSSEPDHSFNLPVLFLYSCNLVIRVYWDLYKISPRVLGTMKAFIFLLSRTVSIKS